MAAHAFNNLVAITVALEWCVENPPTRWTNTHRIIALQPDEWLP
jgi:hypothetical protein